MTLNLDDLITDEFITSILGEMPCETTIVIQQQPIQSSVSSTLGEEVDLSDLGVDVKECLTSERHHDKKLKIVSKSRDFKSCQICKKLAAKHNCYGAQACESCRVFFRRTVQNKTHILFECKKENECVMDSISRKSCQSCRYNLCLKAGMNPSWIMTDKERKAKQNLRREKILEEKRKRTSDNPEMKLVVPRAPDVGFTTEESLKLNLTVSWAKKYRFTVLCDSLCQDLSPLGIYCDMVFGVRSPPGKFLQYMEDQERIAFRGMALGLEEMEDLHEEDRITLVENNFPVAFSLMSAMLFDENYFEQHISELLTVVRELRSKKPILGEVVKRLNTVELQGKRFVFSYDQIYRSPWAEERDAEIRHRHLVTKMQKTLRRCDPSDPEQPLDEQLAALICLVILFTPPTEGGVRLKSRDAVDRVLHQNAYMLHRYIRAKKGKRPGAVFGDSILTAFDAGQAYELHRNRKI